MSEEQLKAFIAKLQADTSLQEKLKAAADGDAVVAIAQEAGFSIASEELETYSQRLSDEELEGVAGGVLPPGGLCAPMSLTGLCRLWKEQPAASTNRRTQGMVAGAAAQNRCV
ncbi:MAG: Nif11-like leader peptide family natural product precursor [Prochlorococcus sp.]|jgi:predicted ribosomally synthesized peptide with nif11-like leader|tara:strand:- start:107 stop:445 length:339 start_codon:yes stop_codon:yes gene_type:complete